MKGEFEGSDGPQTCHQCKWWKRLEEGTRADAEGASRHGMCHFNPERYPTDPGHHCSQFAAKAALDALIEEEAEWVEWTVDKFPYRAKQDGSSMQWLAGGVWRDTNEFEQAAYRKGREVALGEAEKQREQTIRELLGFSCNGHRNDCPNYALRKQIQELVRAVEDAKVTFGNMDRCCAIRPSDWKRICAASRAVKL